MHACQIDPTDTAPLAPESTLSGLGRTPWGRQPFYYHFLRSGGRGCNLPLYEGPRAAMLTGCSLNVAAALGCLQLLIRGNDWQVWGNSKVRHCMLVDGGFPRLPLPLPFHLLPQYRSVKGCYLVPPGGTFQHHWDQAFWGNGLLAHSANGSLHILPDIVEYRILEQGVPGIIISPSYVAVGIFRACQNAHLMKVLVEYPMAAHYLGEPEVQLTLGLVPY